MADAWWLSCSCYAGSGGETRTCLCLHTLTLLSASLEMTQCVTGQPESTKNIWKLMMYFISLICMSWDPLRKSSLFKVSWLVAKADLELADYLTPVLASVPLYYGLLSESESEVAQSCLTLCDPRGPYPIRLCRPWDFPGKNTGVGCHFLLQKIFPTQGWTRVSCIAGRRFTVWATREALWSLNRGINKKIINQNCTESSLLFYATHSDIVSCQFSLFSCVRLSVTPWPTAWQASLSFTRYLDVWRTHWILHISRHPLLWWVPIGRASSASCQTHWLSPLGQITFWRHVRSPGLHSAFQKEFHWVSIET